jgi:hypothetical protein
MPFRFICKCQQHPTIEICNLPIYLVVQSSLGRSSAFESTASIHSEFYWFQDYDTLTVLKPFSIQSDTTRMRWEMKTPSTRAAGAPATRGLVATAPVDFNVPNSIRSHDPCLGGLYILFY